MKRIQGDPVIVEVREVRHRISARFDHDPVRLVAHYMELQKRYQDRLIKTTPLDVEGVAMGLTAEEIVSAIRETRGRGGSES